MLRVFCKKKNIIFISFVLVIVYLNCISKSKLDVYEFKDDSLESRGIFNNPALDEAYSSYKSHSLKLNNFAKHKVIRQRLNSSRTEVSKPFYLITEYTKVFGASKYCTHKLNSQSVDNYMNNEIFQRFLNDKKRESENQQNNQYFNLLQGCVYDNCFFSCNRDHIDISDAVLFHYADLVGESNANAKFLPLTKRTASQIWLLWNDEAGSIDPKFDNVHFNWTITYKANAEVSFAAYGIYMKIPKLTSKQFDSHLN